LSSWNRPDESKVDGFDVSLALTMTLEVESNVREKFPTEKHFVHGGGWCPIHEISGVKVLKNKTLKTKKRSGQAFRTATVSVKRADCIFGAFYP